MRFNKILIAIFIFTFGCLTSISSYAEQNPVGLLQKVADNMLGGLKANKATLKTKPQIVYQLAYKYIVPYAALPEMSKNVLSPQIWNKATAAQRSQFQHEFTTTLIRTYASALTSYEDQKIRFYPPRGGSGKSIQVNSEITGSSREPIHVAYRLIRVGGEWKLFDLSVEGVSMLESFRAQFSDILSQGNMSQLLQRMSGHNKRS